LPDRKLKKKKKRYILVEGERERSNLNAIKEGLSWGVVVNTLSDGTIHESEFINGSTENASGGWGPVVENGSEVTICLDESLLRSSSENEKIESRDIFAKVICELFPINNLVNGDLASGIRVVSQSGITEVTS